MFGMNDNRTSDPAPSQAEPTVPMPAEPPVMPSLPDLPPPKPHDPMTIKMDPPALDSPAPVVNPPHPIDHFSPAEPPAPTAPAMPIISMPSVTNVPSDSLMQLKQQALQSLAPLVGHLDQTPEERFKTTMMMLQASDNAELVKEAYTAANEITDEKARANALLDVVNEINYFTQHGSEPAETPAS
jgi:hypothetical protein